MSRRKVKKATNASRLARRFDNPSTWRDALRSLRSRQRRDGLNGYKILSKYEKRLTVTADGPGGYSLDAGYSEKSKRTVFFGAATIKKNYVSFYLMPVYAFPDLLNGISPALKKRMQGKSCFNFTAIDDATLAELATLTQRGVERFKKEGYA